MNTPRIIIAALKSGSGKTTITCGLLQALKDMGLNPCSFKTGPDYIDPMFHRNVLGIPAGNLDTFFTEDEATRRIFCREYEGDIAVIEGVMGLYDGVAGILEQGSTYDLARVLLAPIILVVDAKGAGKSILAQIKGFLDYDSHNLIKGVILNKTSTAFGNILGNLIENELGISYLGTISNDESLSVSSRHLGLVMPEEIDLLKEKTKLLAKNIQENIDINKLKKIANSCQELSIIEEDIVDSFFMNKNVYTNLKLAVARDKAFCFYYRENISLLEAAGIKLEYFSPIEEEHLPKGISGVLLGGGYPENYLKELSSNESMRMDIKAAYDKGMPFIAECGGFMYLLDAIADNEGNRFEMAGAISGEAFWKGKLVRFGYATFSDGDISIKGHEFHYYDSNNNGQCMTATKPSSNRSWQCIHRRGASYIGFPHLYYPSNTGFVKNFVEDMSRYGSN